MGMFDSSLNLPAYTPDNALDIGNQLQNTALLQQHQGIANQTAQQDLQDKRRSMQLSMLSGILNEPDPQKQRDLANNIIPIANKLNPSFQIDPNADVPTLRALVQSTQPLTNIPASGYLQSPEAQNLTPIIKAGLQSGQLNLKDVLAAQSQNPFMNIGGNASAPAPQSASSPGQTDYSSALSQLPPSMQPTVKAIIEGREFPPSPNSRAPGAAALVQAVNAVDPSFDFVNAGKRQSTAKDFASGNSSNSVTSLNTLAGHLDSLQKAWAGLDNTAGVTPLSNTFSSLANQAAAGTGQSGTLKSFNIAKSAVSDELSKLLKGGVVSDSEKKEWESAIDNGASPEAQKAALSEISGIIQSRLDALNNKYHEGMGPVDVQKDWATPSSRTVFDRLQGRQPQNAATQANQQLNAPPASQPTAKDQADAVFAAKAAPSPPPTSPASNVAPEGTVVHDGNGNTMIKRNGQWQKM
jgi:hypothetical protein